MKSGQQSLVCETSEIPSAKPSVKITTGLLSWSFTCIFTSLSGVTGLQILQCAHYCLHSTFDHLSSERHAKFSLCSK